MINGKKVLAVIPARGGSKGLTSKNLRELSGKPLLAWTIEAAQQSQYIDRLILSSEDAAIIAAAKAYGCDVPFVRPDELAQDETPGIDPILHALEQVPGYDVVVLLQVTSPLRRVEDIDGCIGTWAEQQVNAVVSVTQASENPYWTFTVDNDQRMAPLFPKENYQRRQELPAVCSLNGAVYVADIAWLQQSQSFLHEQTRAYPMPQRYSLDIDTELDLMLAEAIVAQDNQSGASTRL